MKRISILVLAASLLPAHALAQTSTPVDEVVVEGQVQGGDRAMNAFLAGDYETAEIEFERNFKIIQRNERNMENAIRDAANLADSAQANGLPSVAGGGVGGPGNVVTDVVTPNIPYVQARNSDDTLYSGSDLGYQLYMAGLSELQLGKMDEAEESFSRAIKMNGRLYDARMKLALIRLQDGDTAFARKQYARIARAKDVCKTHCRRAQELTEAEATLRELLALYPDG